MQNIRQRPTLTQARRCFAILSRFGPNLFSCQIASEDDEPCLIKAVLRNEHQLLVNLYPRDRLSRGAYAILGPGPGDGLDFKGPLVWQTRVYEVGVRIRYGQFLSLEAYFRPLHLHNGGLAEVA